MMALDWQKCFDSINTEALLNALHRFGLPSHFCKVVRAIYTGRVFEVRECGQISSRCHQDSGICQGCPLSPFLFIIVMSILMYDAKALLTQKSRDDLGSGALFDILYADDTLLVGCRASGVEEYAQVVEQVGRTYGMTLHWGKTQVLSVGSAGRLKKPDGSDFADTRALQYLGALLSGDGRLDSEISRKLCTARADFN